MKFVELFAGVGGFRIGLERAGHECLWSNEWDKHCQDVYKYHWGDIDGRDIRKVDADEVPKHDLLVGGFPCQSFSIAGLRKGTNEERGTLFQEIVRIAKARRPDTLLLENVKGLLSAQNGYAFYRIISELEELGYRLEWQVLNSKNFGVPQNRERVFIVGHLGDESGGQVFPLRETNEDGCLQDEHELRKQFNTIRGNQSQFSNQNLVMLDNNSKGYSIAFPGDGIRLQYPESKTARGRVVKGASQALQASGAGGVLLPNQSLRRLTPVECERLQGFPDNWTKFGKNEKGETIEISDTQRYKMMGNAVTVNVIETIGKRLGEFSGPQGTCPGRAVEGE